MIRALLVDDDPDLARLLIDYLGSHEVEVSHVLDGPRGLAALQASPFDVVLLDVMLPGIDGFEVCRRIRASHDVPVVMLTARGDDTDRIIGLEIGADDYVPKPFNPRELLARMRAVLRRRIDTDDDHESILEAGTVRMDIERHTVAVEGTDVAMPLKEFELLELLLRNSGRVLTRGQLIDRVWGADYFGDTKTLDVHIKRIRSKIEKAPSEPTMLVTVRGLGYRFEA